MLDTILQKKTNSKSIYKFFHMYVLNRKSLYFDLNCREKNVKGGPYNVNRIVFALTMMSKCEQGFQNYSTNFNQTL